MTFCFSRADVSIAIRKYGNWDETYEPFKILTVEGKAVPAHPEDEGYSYHVKTDK